MADQEPAKEPEKPQLTKAELDSLREFHIDISWKGIKKAVRKACYEAPFETYQKTMLKLEGVSRKMMTGKASLFGMPAGIVLRNTARAMHNSAADRYWLIPRIAGGLITAGAVVGLAGLVLAPYVALGVAAAATVVGIPLVAAGAGITALGVPLVGAGATVTTAAAAATAGAGFLGHVCTLAAAGVAAAVVAPLAVYPIFTAATLATSTAIGGVVAAVSTVFAAPLNFKAGWNRMKLARRGVTLSDQQIEQLQTEFDRESPVVKREKEKYEQVFYGLRELSDANKTKIFDGLKKEFDEAAAAKAAEEAAPKQSPSAPRGRRNRNGWDD